MSPYDTPVSAALRFATEIVAWVAGPWAAADLADNGWVAIPALVLLLALPSVFNARGDKNVTAVAVPGPVRLLIEAVLLAVAVAGAWIVWPVWAAVAATVVVAAAILTGMARYRWLAAGAPPVNQGEPS
ncbi:MAG: hypothetical protein KJN71_06870 [Acidimicrobiia bacterium]|nr:hypothetical protein [Acidimicrobiia bacterium]